MLGQYSQISCFVCSPQHIPDASADARAHVILQLHEATSAGITACTLNKRKSQRRPPRQDHQARDLSKGKRSPKLGQRRELVEPKISSVSCEVLNGRRACNLHNKSLIKKIQISRRTSFVQRQNGSSHEFDLGVVPQICVPP